MNYPTSAGRPVTFSYAGANTALSLPPGSAITNSPALYKAIPSSPHPVDSHDLTIRKGGVEDVRQTKRKSIGHIVERQEADLVVGTVERERQSAQLLLLKEQIRFMRRQLVQVEHAQKSLRLQLQILKANHESDTINPNHSIRQDKAVLTQDPSQATTLIPQSLQIVMLQVDEMKRIYQIQKMSKIKLQLQLIKKDEELKMIRQRFEMMNKERQEDKQLINYLREQKCQLSNSLHNAFHNCQRLQRTLDLQQPQIHNLRDTVSKNVQEVNNVEGRIEQIALDILNQRDNYQQTLKKLILDTHQLQEFQSQWSQIERNRQQRINTESKRVEDSQLRIDQQRLQTTVEQLSQHSQTLFDQLQGYKISASQFQQREHQLLSEITILSRGEGTELNELRSRLQTMTVKFNQMAYIYQNNLNQVISDYQMFKGTNTQEEIISIQNIQQNKGQSLSKTQVSEYIQQIKGQTQCKQSDYQQQIQNLQEEIVYMRQAYEQTLLEMKNQYQNQIEVNDDKYTQQLAVYTEQIDQLMRDMSKMKGYRAVEAIEEEAEGEGQEEEEVEGSRRVRQVNEETVRRDLMMHAQDLSDIYVSPPSGHNEGGFILEQILDLDQKIQKAIRNCYQSKPPQKQ